MASATRQQNPLIKQLIAQPQRFDFLQLARLCYYYRDSLHAKRLQFCVSPHLNFPASEVVDSDSDEQQLRFYVTFIGLIGQAGILPEHDSETVLALLQQKEEGLLAFLDMFHHRTIELFYTTWHQCRVLPDQLPAQTTTTEKMTPLAGQALHANDQTLPIQLICHYAGLLGSQNASAEMLCQLLADYFSMPVNICHFRGKWIAIAKDQQTMIGQHGQYNILGSDTILGQRTWHVQNHFDLLVGPVSYQRLLELVPGGKVQALLRKIVITYLGNEFSFSLRILVRRMQIPPCQLGRKAQLGWTMLHSSNQSKNEIVELHLPNFSASASRASQKTIGGNDESN